MGAPYVFPEYIINIVGEVWSTLVKPLGKMPVLPTFFAAFVLGPVLGLLFEAFTPKGRTANYMMNRFGSDLERFLYYSVRGRLFVSVTLDNRKVYIGWTALTPLSGSSHEDGARDFTLLPVLSGYRNSDTLRLEITTDYTGAYEEIQRRGTNVGVEDFAIVIPVSRVVTANPFSLDLEQDIFDISPTQNAGFVSPPTATDEAG